MFQPWRLQLRAAEEALRQGRLEDAGRLASQGELPQFLPAQKLLARIAAELATRGQRRAADGQTMAGWHDLQAADRFGADRRKVDALRKQLVAAATAEAEAYLAAGDPTAAIDRLDALLERDASSRDVRALRELAQLLATAQRLAQRGQFPAAAERLTAASALRPDLKFVAQRRQAYEKQAEVCRRIAEKLHASLGQEDFTTALTLADEWLAIAPECDAALAARRRAWSAVGAPLASPWKNAPHAPRNAPNANHSPSPHSHSPAHGRTMLDPSSDVQLDEPAAVRFLLWIDGVGGYLVCEEAEVVLGQPVAEGRVDVPILGDVSRRHATIRRDGEGYLITPRRPTKVDGRTVEGVAWLADGSLIELGTGVKLRFRRPHPLSASARLEFVSHHRTQPAADAVLLLAESLVLGPGPASHVQCRDWDREVVLCRQGSELACRTAGRIVVDGANRDGQAPITRGSRVSGDDFSLKLENL